MKLQYLPRVSAKTALPLTKDKFLQLIRSTEVEENIRIARQCLAEGNTEAYGKAKALLPAVQWVGYDETGQGRRTADALTPTQLFMIDIDHMTSDPIEAWQKIRKTADERKESFCFVMVHITPSGEGLRLVMAATMPFETVKEHMDWTAEQLELEQYGKYDSVCKDLSRLSFLVPEHDFLFMDEELFDLAITLNNIKKAYDEDKHETTEANDKASAEADDKAAEYRELTYHGHKYTDIVKHYLAVFGEPEYGERHNFYNRMILDFRSICNNDPYLLHAILPNFVGDSRETLGQCVGLCKSNKTVQIPRQFFFFLKDNGYLNKENPEDEDENEDEDEAEKIPELPPIFKEFCSICPPDFVKPTIAALLPILGTLTSYVRGEYNGKSISTTFFSCIYAPPSSGKSFVDLPQKLLFSQMRKRDLLNQLRENIYRQLCSRKKDGTNPEDPHVTKRFLATKYTEADFFPKMVDLKGYHMFLFAAEIDQLIKGMKYGGGGSDKSDLLRIGWDNGEYSQQNRSPNSWSGVVNIYLNILMTGTLNQVFRCFKTVEDGMITRMTFCSLQNQEFADIPVWKKLTRRQMDIIEDFVKKCDSNTYEEPLEFTDFDEAQRIGEAEEYDDQVPWRYKFRPFKEVSTKWLMPYTNKWLKKWQQIAIRDNDHATDVFRRRRGEIAHRMALICSQLWPTFGKKEQKITRDFILWWLDVEMEESYNLFGQKYNEAMEVQTIGKSKSPRMQLFDMLPSKFSRADIEDAKKKCQVVANARSIVSLWKKAGLCTLVEKNVWEKNKQ